MKPSFPGQFDEILFMNAYELASDRLHFDLPFARHEDWPDKNLRAETSYKVRHRVEARKFRLDMARLRRNPGCVILTPALASKPPVEKFDDWIDEWLKTIAWREVRSFCRGNGIPTSPYGIEYSGADAQLLHDAVIDRIFPLKCLKPIKKNPEENQEEKPEEEQPLRLAKDISLFWSAIFKSDHPDNSARLTDSWLNPAPTSGKSGHRAKGFWVKVLRREISHAWRDLCRNRKYPKWMKEFKTELGLDGLPKVLPRGKVKEMSRTDLKERQERLSLPPVRSVESSDISIDAPSHLPSPVRTRDRLHGTDPTACLEFLNQKMALKLTPTDRRIWEYVYLNRDAVIRSNGKLDFNVIANGLNLDADHVRRQWKVIEKQSLIIRSETIPSDPKSGQRPVESPFW